MNTHTLRQKFKEVYGRDAESLYFAPGRVNLIGEHIDYNGGRVFPCALSFGTYLLAAKRQDSRMAFTSLNIDTDSRLFATTTTTFAGFLLYQPVPSSTVTPR